jgi:Bax protein
MRIHFITRILSFIFISSLLATAILFNFCNRPKVINPEDITARKSLTIKQKTLLADFLPKIKSVNDQILIERNTVLDIKKILEKSGKLKNRHVETLNKILIQYSLAPIKNTSNTREKAIEANIDSLTLRVDIIPVKLVMAQAIIESGWGKSEFAKQINNYFGVHCYSKGCGVKPQGIKDPHFEVKIYPTIEDAISDYLNILNTGYAYETLRITRAMMRKNNEPLDAIALAKGLDKYSQTGDKYVDLVQSIIENYLPENVESLLKD